MKKYFFKQLYEFKVDLNDLSLDKNNVLLLLKIQERLLSWHKSLENFTHLRKKRLNDLSKLKKDPSNNKLISSQIKKSIQICIKQLDELKTFKLWARHLGNSIPHLYYDKGELRAYSYSVNSKDLKELSGDIFGKEGQDLELEIFYNLIAEGYKALLNDLTSIIRHADIMVMERDSPFLMEVKTSKATSKTAAKQIQNIRKIENYLSQDSSIDLRGGAILKRVSSSIAEVSNRTLINENLKISSQNGHCLSKIEDGFYCLSYLPNIDHSEIDFSTLDSMEKPACFLLNQFKNEEDHSLFFPYSLLIDIPEIFANFLSGQFFIYFFLDLKLIETKAQSMDLVITPVSDFFVLEVSQEGRASAYSFTLMKAIVEFTSIHWALDELCNIYFSSDVQEFINRESIL